MSFLTQFYNILKKDLRFVEVFPFFKNNFKDLFLRFIGGISEIFKDFFLDFPGYFFGIFKHV